VRLRICCLNEQHLCLEPQGQQSVLVKMKTSTNDEKYSKPLNIQTNTNFGTQQTKLGVTQEMGPHQQDLV
jgi:hypothetical protein